MRTFLLLLRAAAAVLTAVVGRIGRRLLHGPIVPSWSWGVELRAVELRALIMATASHRDRVVRQQLEARLDLPLPRRLREVLAVEKANLGGRPGEWIIRKRTDRGLEDAATILYLHGGAYVAGSLGTHRMFASRLTWATRTRTYLLDYRLAPQHRFPAAVDDAEAAYQALLASGVDPAKLFVAGDSAGGGLSCALLLRLRDKGRPLPAGAVLFSPYTDLEHTGSSIQRNAATDYLPVLPVRVNELYLGGADPQDPLASPVHGDYRSIPPLLVFAGGKEMILDDSLRLVDKARRDGVEVTLHIEEDMYHVWPALLPSHPATLRALARAAEFIQERAAR